VSPLQGIGFADLEVRECADGGFQHGPPMVEDFLELSCAESVTEDGLHSPKSSCTTRSYAARFIAISNSCRCSGQDSYPQQPVPLGKFNVTVKYCDILTSLAR
jgi:hypothetical protein